MNRRDVTWVTIAVLAFVIGFSIGGFYAIAPGITGPPGILSELLTGTIALMFVGMFWWIK